jgi:hypothetical protein
MIPGCTKPYTNSVLDRAYVAAELNISEWTLKANLHVIKQRCGFHGKSVLICLDQGASLEYLRKCV